MAASSLLQDRHVEGITLTELEEHENRSLLNSTVQDKLSTALSLISILQIAYDSKLVVDQNINPIQHQLVLGEGATFSVRVNLRSGGQFAGTTNKEVFKISKQSYDSEFSGGFNASAVRAFLLELKVLAKPGIRGHPNITKLDRLGWAVTGTQPLSLCPTLVVEEARLGTLAEFESEHQDLPYLARKQLSLDVANGLQALHSQGILHGDVKAENVLIFTGSEPNTFVAKLSDFGCSVFIQDTHEQRIRLPAISPPWHAPEAHDLIPIEDLLYTDVFSFGLLCWRIMVMSHPADLFDLPLDKSLNKELFRELVELPSLHYTIPRMIKSQIQIPDADEYLRLHRLFRVSLSKDPRERSLAEVLDLLTSDIPWRQWAQLRIEDLKIKPDKSSFDVKEDLPAEILSRPTAHKERNPGFLAQAALGFRMPSTITFSLAELYLHPRICELVFRAFSVTATIMVEQAESLTSNDVSVLRASSWAVLYCSIVGFGCDRYPAVGLKSLIDAVVATSEAGSWKGSCSVLSLCHALSYTIPHEQLSKLLSITRTDVTESPFIASRFPTFVRDKSVLDRPESANSSNQNSRLGLTVATGPNMNKVEGLGTSRNIHAAAARGQTEVLYHLLKDSDIDIDATNEHGDTALVLACRHGQSQFAFALLEAGADAGIQNKLDENGLHWLSSIAESDRSRLANELRKAGAQLYSTDDFSLLPRREINEDMYLMHGYISGSPLLRVIAHGDVDAFLVLWDLVRSDGEDGALGFGQFMNLCYQPLWLSFALHVDQVAAFILNTLVVVLSQLAPDPQGINEILLRWLANGDYNALFAYVVTPRYALARLALHGSDWKAAQQRSLDCLFRHHIYTTSPNAPEHKLMLINECLLQRNDEALEHLLTKNDVAARVNEIDAAGNTPIDLAIDKHRLVAFRLLIAAGAELDTRKIANPRHRLAAGGASFLHVCANSRGNMMEFTQSILDHGVPASVTDINGTSPLFLAVIRSNFELARLLMEHGASVNTPLVQGLTTLGCILDPGIAWQCDDQIESLRFVLEIEENNRKASFNIRAEDDTTALMKAGYYPGAGVEMTKMLEILLKRFNDPVQLNKRMSRESKTAAIQGAISASNPAAVKAFIDAGADLTIVDNKGIGLLELATQSFYQQLDYTKQFRKRDREKAMEQCLEVISILSRSGSWPHMLDRSIAMEKLQAETTDLVKIMMRVPHHISEELKLHMHLGAAINSRIAEFEKDLNSLVFLVEIRRQLDRIFSPVFHVDLRFMFALTDDVSYPGLDLQTASDRATQEAAVNLQPVLKEVNLGSFAHLKNAVVLERILDAERALPPSPDRPYGRWGFAKYARSGNLEDTMFDYRFVEYPMTLLQCWRKLIVEDQLDIRSLADRGRISRFIWILRIRDKQCKDGRFPLQEYDDEFTNFHFGDILGLQGGEISAEHVIGAPGLIHGCRCMARKIGNFSTDWVKEFDMKTSAKAKDSAGPVSELAASLKYYEVKVKETQAGEPHRSWKKHILDSEEFLLYPPDAYIDELAESFEKVVLGTDED